MPIVSQAGNTYIMNIMDDYSGYVWCIPLKHKSDASPALQIWHHIVKAQSGFKLKILITDNGELVSLSTLAWCDAHGIDH